MKTVKKDVLSIMLVLMFFGCFGCRKSESTSTSNQKSILFTPSGTPSDNSVYLEQVSTNNDEITLALKIKGGPEVFSVALEIDFDGGKIQYISSSEGTFMNQGGAATTFPVELEEGSNGILLIGLSRQAGSSGVDGDGTLCQLVFKALVTQTNTAIDLNSTNSLLKSLSGDITGTSWLGGALSYQ